MASGGAEGGYASREGGRPALANLLWIALSNVVANLAFVHPAKYYFKSQITLG